LKRSIKIDIYGPFAKLFSVVPMRPGLEIGERMLIEFWHCLMNLQFQKHKICTMSRMIYPALTPDFLFFKIFLKMQEFYVIAENITWK